MSHTSGRAIVPAVVLLMIALMVPPVQAAAGTGSDPQSEEEVDHRERLVGGGFALEKELETDRSLETWLYVFSALMALCVGWLCFKPTRVYTGKKKGLKKKKGGAGKGKKPKK